MTAWVVITRVVITRVVKGGQNIILSSMGMLHVKTKVIEVGNVESRVNLGLGVVITAF